MKTEGQIKHSQEIHDIITRPPNWMLRWGIVVILIILSVLIAMSCVIQYPDIQKVPLTIRDLNPPKPMASKNYGKIAKILVANGANVIAGEDLFYLEGSADHSQVLSILQALKSIPVELARSNGVSGNPLPAHTGQRLGELDTSYKIFHLLYDTYLKDTYFKEKRSLLIKEIDSINANTSASNTNRLEIKKQELVELVHVNNVALKTLLNVLEQLVGKFETWKSKNVISAARSGKIIIHDPLSIRQFVEKGDILCYISNGPGLFCGELVLTKNIIGKISEGQIVNIKISNYPYQEYGAITSEIKHLVSPEDAEFVKVKIEIPNIKNYGLKKSVKLRNGMLADAEIIIESKSVFKRVAGSFLSKLK